MTKAVFIKRGGALYPAHKEAAEMARSWPEGKEIMVKVHLPRNPRHHRLLFALLNMVMESGAWEGSHEALLDWCKLQTGHYRMDIWPDGKTQLIPKSIDFESMPQDKFSRWFDRVIWLICDRLLGGHDWEELRAEIYATLDGGLSDHARDAA